MQKKLVRIFFRMLMDERGSQNAKSAVGILFFFMFIGGGALINFSSLPLSYNIAFGDSGGLGSGTGKYEDGRNAGGGYTYLPITKARLDYIRLTVWYTTNEKETKNGESVANDVTVGSTGWLLPQNTVAEDGNRAITELTFGEISYYFRAINFGFTVPKNARITGVTLSVKRSAEGPDVIQDYSVKLVIGGKTAGAENKHTNPWPSNDTFDSYGGINDLWGLTRLSPNDVNIMSFGVVIAAQNGIVTPPTTRAAPQIITPPVAPIAAKNTNPIQPVYTEINIETLIAAVEKEKTRANVIALQNALIRAGRGPAADNLLKFGPTGYYGPVTKRAVKEWRLSQPVIPAVAPIVAPRATITPPPVVMIAPTPRPTPKQTVSSPSSNPDSDIVQKIKTPLLRGNTGDDVVLLQNLLIKWNKGPEARHLITAGASGVYGWSVERTVTELQNFLIRKNTGLAAQALNDAFVQYGYSKGSWGDATKAAIIEFLDTLR